MRKTKHLNSNMNLLGKHTKNSTSTDMLNCHCQIESPGGGLIYETDGDARRLA